MIHKGQKICDGLMNPRIVVPEGGDKFPRFQDNQVYAYGYEELYKYIINFLSAQISHLLFDGAQRVVYEIGVDSNSVLFDFPDSSGNRWNSPE